MKAVLRVLFLLAVLVLPVFAQQQARNTRFVAVEVAEVRSSSGFFAQDVGTLRLGDEVTLIRDSGRWSEIRAGSITGWVTAASLSPRPTVRAAAPVTPGEVALAGKGFGREMEIEYRRTGDLDYSPVDQMETMSVPAADLRRFIIEGRLSGVEQ
ncbi:MAG: SH3 domain-containing protein [Treponema sp.]|nr:SH3 domain-containing protein [Treponema sp.]